MRMIANKSEKIRGNNEESNAVTNSLLETQELLEALDGNSKALNLLRRGYISSISDLEMVMRDCPISIFHWYGLGPTLFEKIYTIGSGYVEGTLAIKETRARFVQAKRRPRKIYMSLLSELKESPAMVEKSVGEREVILSLMMNPECIKYITPNMLTRSIISYVKYAGIESDMVDKAIETINATYMRNSKNWLDIELEEYVYPLILNLQNMAIRMGVKDLPKI